MYIKQSRNLEIAVTAVYRGGHWIACLLLLSISPFRPGRRRVSCQFQQQPQRTSSLPDYSFNFDISGSVVDRGVGDWGSCPGHQGRGAPERGEQK